MADNARDAPRGHSRISTKRQVTIPARVLQRAGLDVGDVVTVDADGTGRVVVTAVGDRVNSRSGALAAGGELRRSVEGLRDEW